ncbi:MAG TPA: ATP-binding protein [Rhabdochlamydiaceae bacterium]|nr:ATP-binding protein [Rhabdochlamydiaceae bacterium]
MKFIGRKKELESLELLLRKTSASLVVIRGRRRVGKSRLIKEFVLNKKSWIFTGLPPIQGITKQRQLDAFSNQLAQNLNMPKIQASEWIEHFTFLGNQAKGQKIVIVLDEISWMGSEDPDFLGQLKTAWDLNFSDNPELILIICGSVSSWIEENILKSTGFVGRISVDMVLEELSIAESSEFWGAQKNRVSSHEKFKVLSVTGGIPKYLEEIIPSQSAEDNIHRLCFQSNGLLFREFDQIFSDLFSKKAQTYSNIIKTLAHAPLSLDEICEKLGMEKGGFISHCLDNLDLAGFIQEDCTWNLLTKRESRLKKFRLKDNYIRFYLRYIATNQDKISKDLFESKSFMHLPGWESVMGLQFENLVVNNLKSLCKILRIDLVEITNAGPFFQRKTQRQKGCQIDLMIQTRHNTLYICEIKFSASEIKGSVIEEMKKKIESISYPKNFSIRPVLIHVNGVSQAVKESKAFTEIIDLSQFFNQT